MRNSTIDICKGLAIISMVIGHADCPSEVLKFIYLWHMPLFFITTGYFFSKKYLSDEATYMKKRVKRLYVPMVKWSLITLALNPVFFATGILNEQFGNVGGGVTHPLSWKQMAQHAADIITTMGNYDVFLLSAFWFFRALFIGSIGFLVLWKLFAKIPKINKHDETIILAICVLTLSLSLLKYGGVIKFKNINQGGNRELMCMFFMGLGFLFRKYEQQIARYKALGWLMIVPLMVFTLKWSTSLSLNTNQMEVLRLPFAASAGFLFIYTISSVINNHDNWLKSFLTFAGKESMTVMIFHIFAFKLLCPLHIWIAGLEWGQIGCHMVPHTPATTQWIWIFYSIVGVGVPLGVKYLKENYKLSIINK